MNIRKISILTLVLGLSAGLVLPACGAEQRLPGALIIDAASFIDHFPKGDTLTTARQAELPWLFNNLGITLHNSTELAASMQVPAEGNYHLFVRSRGAGRSSFKVSINGQVTESTFGDGPLALKDAGEFYLQKTIIDVRITAITPGATLDVLVLSPDPELKEADLWSVQYPAEVVMHKDYQIPRASSIKFGDLTGDGKMDFVVLTPGYSAYAYDNTGSELWHWDAPQSGATERAESEAPGSIWDFDSDGRAELIHWRLIDGREYLCMSDGITGEIKYKVEWPAKALPHAYGNFRTAIARLHEGVADGLIVYSDIGTQQTISAYGPRLNLLWSREETRPKGYFGRNVYPVDINGDSVSEIFLGHLALDATGKVLWSDVEKSPSSEESINSARFADLNGDGGLEMIVAQNKVGVGAYQTNNGEKVWSTFVDDAQKLEIGNFLTDSPSPQIITSSIVRGDVSKGEPEVQSLLRWYGPAGRPLEVWPANPINVRSTLVKGDWTGSGKNQLFWNRFRLDSTGKGTLFFPEEVYQMFDFIGNGGEQVICLDNASGVLRIYGNKEVRSRGTAKREEEYLRTRVANHADR